VAALTFAFVPSIADPQLDDKIEHLAGFLSEDVGQPVTGKRADSYNQVVDDLQCDRVQFAWMPPVLQVLAEERVALTPLCSAVREGRTRYHSALFVDAHSPYMSVAQLKGRRVAWVDATSAAGYLYPRVHLAARGIDPVHHFGEEQFLGSHGAVVRQVLDGRADIGATYAERPPVGEAIRSAAFVEIAPERAVRVLDWTGPIPNDMVVGHGLMPMELQQRFARALLRLGTFSVGRTLMHNVFRADKFVLANPRSLRALNQMVRQARAFGLLPHL
jgi:phosphate/phosphite/phosphonate ABC transporter binding protein